MGSFSEDLEKRVDEQQVLNLVLVREYTFCSILTYSKILHYPELRNCF